jgi:hypothetical protein
MALTTSKCILSSPDSHVYHPVSSYLLSTRIRQCCAHIFGKSRCLRNHCLLKVLYGIAGQSGFWECLHTIARPEPWRLHRHTVHHLSLRTNSVRWYRRPYLFVRLLPKALNDYFPTSKSYFINKYNHSVPRSTTSWSFNNCVTISSTSTTTRDYFNNSYDYFVNKYNHSVPRPLL